METKVNQPFLLEARRNGAPFTEGTDTQGSVRIVEELAHERSVLGVLA